MDKAKRTTLQTQAAKTYNNAQKKQRPLSVPIHQSVNFGAVSSRQLGHTSAANPLATSLGEVETIIEIPADLGFSEEELWRLSLPKIRSY